MMPAPGRASPDGPRFDQTVPDGGYAWWYVDAISDDGAEGLTIIAFIGSVFSPYYAFARRRGAADPLNHCALNVALYRNRGSRWSMTERGRGSVSRSATQFAIGPSSLTWDGDALTISIDEISVPRPARLRGTVRVVPSAITRQAFTLNAEGGHRWWPIAPCARVEVTMRDPALRWQGDGYLDMNGGDAPIEQGFRYWEWSRGATSEGAAILYEAECRDGSRTDLAMHFSRDGTMTGFTPPPVTTLPRSAWRIDRSVRSDDRAHVTRTLTDAPFYARSLVSAKLQGEPVLLMHESLSLDRFRMPVVQAMLPFRMPRRG
jgi:carotenoid 1,2-hydratase